MKTIISLATIFFIGIPWMSAQNSSSDTSYMLIDTIITFDSETKIEEIKVIGYPVYRKVDQMPVFGLCEFDPKPQECTRKFLLDCMYNYIQYPDSAKKNKIQGVVYASFVVHDDGKRSHVKITRSLGYGCDEEVLRFIHVLPPMLPARLRGETVYYEYVMPVKFQLKK